VKNIKKIIKVLYLLLLFTLVAESVASASDLETLSISSTDINDVGEILIPIPFMGDYKIVIKLKTVTNAKLPLRYDVNKRVLSPGERVTITLTPSDGKMNVKVSTIVKVYDQDGNILYDYEFPPVEIPQFDIPAEFSYKIPLPLLPLESVGIPAELGIILNLKYSVHPSIELYMQGLSPKRYKLLLTTLGSETITVTKTNQLGAVVTIKRWSLNSYSTVKPSIGVTVSGVPTPLKYDLQSVTFPIAQQSQVVNKELVVLKTPINIKLNDIGVAHVGDRILITGKVTPAGSGIRIKIMVKHEAGVWKTLNIVSTDYAGSFSTVWIPSEPGRYMIKAIHEGSRFTVESESNIITASILEVKKPTQLVQTPTPQQPKGIFPIPFRTPGFEIITGVLAGIVALIILRKISKQK